MPAEQVALADVLRGRRGGFLAALLLAEFGAGMQGIAYSTVLPVVARDLDGFALFGATLAAGPIAAVLMLSVAGPVLARVRPGIVVLVATVLYLLGAGLAVFAPSMGWVLAGTIVRGVGAGLIAGFGMGALGALYDERERPRVFGLFALIWLVPSVAGPALNAAIAAWAGWRWAIAWPALIVLVARVLMGAYFAVIPWQRRREPVRAVAGLAVAGFLVIGAWASALAEPWAPYVFALAGAGSAAAIVAFLVRGAHSAPLARVLAAFAILCASFFGLYELLAVTVIEALGGTLLWAAVAVTAGLLGWTLMGLRPRPDAVPDRVIVGTVLVGAAIVGLAVTVTVATGPVAVALVVACAAVAGLGMGSAYPLLSSEPFSAPGHAATTGALISFAETAGSAWAVLIGGGLYSVLHGTGAAPRAALVPAFAVCAVVAAAGVAVAATRRARAGA